MTSIENTIEFLENIDNLFDGEFFAERNAPSSVLLVNSLKERKESGKVNKKIIQELKNYENSSWNDNLMWLYLKFMEEKGEKIDFNFVFNVNTLIEHLI